MKKRQNSSGRQKCWNLRIGPWVLLLLLKNKTWRQREKINKSAESSAVPILAPPRMPKPRSKKVATIQLKPRIINRPMRESTCKKEQAFIVKNRPFLETNRLLNSNTHHYNDDLAESNSIWLKAEGFINRRIVHPLLTRACAHLSNRPRILLTSLTDEGCDDVILVLHWQSCRRAEEISNPLEERFSTEDHLEDYST